MSKGDARPESLEDRVLALLAIAEDQQLAVKAAIEGLAIERAAFAKERVALREEREALFDKAEKRRAVADGLIAVSGKALAASTQATSSAATAAVNKALANVAETTTQAAHVAAESTINAFAAAANEGKMVRSQLIGTIAEFKREWRWIIWVSVALAFATIGVMGYGFVWWQRQELNELAVQRDKLAAEVGALQAQADEGRRAGSAKRPK
jgi:hypothetical protein